MFRIGTIRGIELFLEQVPQTRHHAIHGQIGQSCRVRVVKESNTPLAVTDAVDKGFSFGDIFQIITRDTLIEAANHFCPGSENYQFHSSDFGSDEQGKFGLTYTIRPVQTPFE